MLNQGSLRIGFDAKRAFFNRSGLGNYSRDTIRILCSIHPENKYFLYSPKKTEKSLFNSPSGSQIKLPVGFFNSYFSSAWRSNGIVKDLKSDRINLYHGLSNELPLNIHKSGIKSIVTIHDLIFLSHPQYYKRIDRNIYKRKFAYSAIHSDLIIAVSHKTKEEIINHLGVNPEKISVVYQGCNPIFQRVESSSRRTEISAKYNLPADFLLCVGTIESRKNQLNIVKAVHQGKVEIPVVLVGKATAYCKEIENYIQSNKVRDIKFLHNVETEDLPAIYQSARLFVYPSLVEGFGIPILEALFSGIPVITSRGGSMEEAGGNGAKYVDPGNTDELQEAIKSCIEDKGMRKNLIEQGIKHSVNFIDRTIAENLMREYKRVL